MENIRFILIVLFGSLLYFLWEEWQKDYGPKPPAPVVQEQSPIYSEATSSSNNTDDVPVSPTASDDQPSIDAPVKIVSVPSGEKISVRTDVYHLEIDSFGGSITLLDLLDYPRSKEEKDIPIRILNDDPASYYVAQSGILSNANSAPNHHTQYQTESFEYVLDYNADSLQVPLTWRSTDGVEFIKTFTFKKGSHLIDVEHQVINRSPSVWRGRQYGQMQRKVRKDDDDSTFIRTYTGGVIYNDEDKYEKISFDDMYDDNLSLEAKGGWSAIIQHYFLSAWIPPENEKNNYYTKALSGDRYVIGSFAAGQEIQPNQQGTFREKLVIGPKIQSELEIISPGLELTVDYGFLTVIAKPVFWLLHKFHSFLKNWGWAIICTTFVIKALFFKLSEASYKSMAKMRKLQPKLQAIRERCGDDKQRMNQEIMGLYKKEKVNPLGGCLPILVQIPVFISLYWVLLESVELRQAPFMLWLDDLSTRDPWFILPLLMGLSMWIQQRLNPAPLDPLHEKVMKMFPIVFTIFFMFFPSGLVLYWVVNNSLSIIQQWYITRKIERGEIV